MEAMWKSHSWSCFISGHWAMIAVLIILLLYRSPDLMMLFSRLLPSLVECDELVLV
jgi:hypothetical protein